MAVDQEKLTAWFAPHSVRPEQRVLYESIRHQAKALAQTILDHTPPCADQSDAIRKVREAMLMAHTAIACGGR